MLRFLWFDDIYKEHPEIVEYQFCRLVFGLMPSPAILSCVIQHHLVQHKPSEPEAVLMLQDSLYIDKLVGGAMDDTQASQMHEKASDIMNAAGFKLRKWTSNSRILREKVTNNTDQVRRKRSYHLQCNPSGAGKRKSLVITCLKKTSELNEI
jgi:mannosyltransferase OCH1-like enzyme